jgi:predicted AAA+ superfamily ATPase
MLAALKEIILDFQKENLFTGITRHIDYEIIKDKVFVCIGVRRSGKTTLLHQVIRTLKEEYGVAGENIVYINFFDDRLTELKQGNLQPILEAYFTLYPEKKGSQEVCFFFDEIQEVKQWELFVERLQRTEKCRIFLSGSSAKLLSKEISTQMRGRSLSWELFPFSFKEFLDYKKCGYSGLDAKTRYNVQKNFDLYFRKGGFPEIQDKSDKITLLIHQEYYKSILLRDIIERYDISHPQAVMQIGYRLLTSVSNLYTINRITEYIKSFGYKVPKSFVSECISWFEDAYFLFSVKIFSKSLNIQNTNSKKIYCIDHGLVRSISPDIQQKEGYLLENIIFINLRTRYPDIYYYRTKGGNEIDFIWVSADGQKNLVQVCRQIGDAETEARETRALYEGMRELDINESYIVTYNEEKNITLNGKTIHIIPAWRFLLGELK